MFQTRLRELRESAGYKTQQAFADAFGVAQSTVGGWEAGIGKSTRLPYSPTPGGLVNLIISDLLVEINRRFLKNGRS